MWAMYRDFPVLATQAETLDELNRNLKEVIELLPEEVNQSWKQSLLGYRL